MKLTLTFLFFVLGNLLYGQAITTVVESPNGKTLEGELIKYQQGIQLELKLENGKTIIIPEKEIARITQKRYTSTPAEPVAVPEVAPYQFREKGVYNATSFSGMLGIEDAESVVGLGLEHTIGYQINRLIGIGSGLGIHAFALQGGFNVLSAHAEIRGYLFKKPVSPYFSIGGGYGWLMPPEEEGIADVGGGTMGRIGLGLRLGASSAGNVLAGLGYHFQRSTFTRELAFGELETATVIFHRLAVSIGLIF
jgi:hypothetical protein